MDSDMLSTVNGENSVDGIQNWHESSEEESSFESDLNQTTEKKLIRKRKGSTMSVMNDPLRSCSNQIAQRKAKRSIKKHKTVAFSD